MKNSTRLRALREAGDVQRWHSTPHLQDASLARHQWGVAVLLLELVSEPSVELIRAGLLHDVPERWHGDTPSPARREYPSLQEGEDRASTDVWAKLYRPADSRSRGLLLTEVERSWLSFCDCADALLWANAERRLGSSRIRNAIELLRNCLGDLAIALDQLEEEGSEAFLTVIEAMNHADLPDSVKELPND